MKTPQSSKAFSIVELVVAISILVVLSSIAFISLSSNVSDSRDATRISDLSSVKAALNLYKQKRSSYPLPWDMFEVSFSWSIISYQGLLNSKVKLSTLDTLPKDPKVKVPYLYSVTKSRKEFQLAWTLENKEESKAIVEWDYSSVTKNILPAIIFARQWWGAFNVDNETNRRLSLFNESINNYPYTFDSPFEPYSNNVSLSDLLSEAENNSQFWQNSDYRSCAEIVEAGKSIWDAEYQILDAATNTFIDTDCTSM